MRHRPYWQRHALGDHHDPFAEGGRGRGYLSGQFVCVWLAMKLNIGCGLGHKTGYINVDVSHKVGADVVLDITTPWPWDDGSISEVHASHVLEHLQDLNGFMVQAYRCMAPRAEMHIAVPHPRSDYYLGDPTHVRPITENVLQLYDRALCLEWHARGFSNTPLALMLGVNFLLVDGKAVIDEEWKPLIDKEPKRLQFAVRHFYNVVTQLEFVLRRV